MRSGHRPRRRPRHRRTARAKAYLPAHSVQGKEARARPGESADCRAIRDVELASGRDVSPVVACRSEILTGIDKHYARPSPGRSVWTGTEIFSGTRGGGADVLDLDLDRADSLPDPKTTPDGAPVQPDCPRRDQARASDIHIEPGAGKCGFDYASTACCAITSSFRGGCTRPSFPASRFSPGWISPSSVSRKTDGSRSGPRGRDRLARLDTADAFRRESGPAAARVGQDADVDRTRSVAPGTRR